MVIVLKNELIDYCNLDTQQPKYVQIFELLAEVRKRGFHFVIPERKLLDKLITITSLNESAQAVYKKIHNKYTSESAIKNSASHFKFIISDSENINQYKTRIDKLKSNTFLNLNRLLLENSDDELVINNIIEYYTENKGHNSIDVEWEVMHGGGSTTHNEFKKITNSALHFTLCLLDSDKKFPNDSIGQTAEKFTKGTHKSVFGKHYILEVHELENLLPPKSARSYVYGKQLKKSKYAYNCFIRTPFREAYSYHDIKKGLSCERLNRTSQDFKNYWSTILQNMGIDYHNCACQNAGCQKFFIHPLGSIRDKVLEFYKSISGQIKLDLDVFYIPIWNKIGEYLFNVFCKPKSMFQF